MFLFFVCSLIALAISLLGLFGLGDKTMVGVTIAGYTGAWAAIGFIALFSVPLAAFVATWNAIFTIPMLAVSAVVTTMAVVSKHSSPKPIRASVDGEYVPCRIIS